MKKRMFVLLVMILALMLVANAAFAMPEIERVRYQGKGVVRVDFDVDDDDDDDDDLDDKDGNDDRDDRDDDDDDDGFAQYKKPRVVVEDAQGNAYKANILKKTKRFLTFKVPSAPEGRYDFTISGIRKRGEKAYGEVKGQFDIAKAEMPQIGSVKYRGNGIVGVSLTGGPAGYKDAKATVADDQGNAFQASLQKQTKNGFTIKVAAIKAGASYRFTVTGIGAKGESQYGELTGAFTAPSLGDIRVKKVEYEGKGKLEIDFYGKVSYQNPTVRVTGVDGTAYSGRVKSRDDDEMEIVIPGLPQGRNLRYTFEIDGVSVKGANDYQTVSGEFVAWDKDDDDDDRDDDDDDDDDDRDDDDDDRDDDDDDRDDDDDDRDDDDDDRDDDDDDRDDDDDDRDDDDRDDDEDDDD